MIRYIVCMMLLVVGVSADWEDTQRRMQALQNGDRWNETNQCLESELKSLLSCNYHAFPLVENLSSPGRSLVKKFKINRPDPKHTSHIFVFDNGWPIGLRSMRNRFNPSGQWTSGSGEFVVRCFFLDRHSNGAMGYDSENIYKGIVELYSVNDGGYYRAPIDTRGFASFYYTIDTTDSYVVVMSRYIGIDRDGNEVYKSYLFPDLVCPMVYAMDLNFVASDGYK